MGSVRRSAVGLLAAAAGDARIDRAFREALDRTRVTGLTWVERVREAGEVRADVSAETFLDLVDGAVYHRLIWRGEVLGEDDVPLLVDLLLSGVAPDGPSGGSVRAGPDARPSNARS